MRFVILHYHILKNAGTTVEEILYQNFRERLLRFDIPDRDEEVTQGHLLSLLQDNPQVTAVSSHQIYYPVPQAPGFIFFPLCFLRDPLDRIRSIYDYFRDKPSAGDPVSDLASRVGLGEFTAYLVENYPWMVNDVQVNLLSNGLINDQPRGLVDLDRAIERMLDTSFLGVVDRFNESLIAGQHSLRTVFPNLDCGQAPVNVSGGMGNPVAARIEKFQRACDPGVWTELVRMNQMDQELLRRAGAEVDRRLKQVNEPERKLHALGHRIKELAAAQTSAATSESVDSRVAISGAAGQNVGPSFVERTKRLLRAVPHLGALRRLFDAEFYLARYPDVKEAGANPLVHYLTYGMAEDRKPHPLFEPNYYFNQCPEARAAGMNPLIHFLNSTPGKWCNPHMLFDCDSYARAHPAVMRLGVNPLLHRVFAGPPVQADRTEPCVRMEIDDVQVSVVCRAPTEGETHGDGVFVWQDGAGQKKYAAPPEQQPFFESVRYDQLLAQDSTREREKSSVR